MQNIARLQHFDDRAAGLIRPLGFEDGLMKVMVKTLTVRIDAPDTMSFKDREELALGRLDAGQEAARARVLGLGFGEAIERPPQIVSNRKQLLGEAGNRIF